MSYRRDQDPVDKAIVDAGAGCAGLIIGLLGIFLVNQYEQNRLRKKYAVSGVTIGRYGNTPITIPDGDRMKHAHVMGATGTGKTTLLVNMAIQDMNAMLDSGEPKYGVGVIDPKGDFVDRLLRQIPSHRRGDVILFDPTDTAKPLGFNILENVPEDSRSRTTGEVLLTFKKIFGKDSWGPRLEYILREVILTLMEIPGATLLDIPTLLLDEDFRKGVLPHITNFEVTDFWGRLYPQFINKGTGISIIAPILNKVGPWLAYPEVRNIIGQVQSSFNLRRIMDEKKIFLARMPEGVVGEDIRQLLGALLITKFQSVTDSRANILESQRQPFILYVDEFQNFTTEASQKILTEARSFGLGLVVANQHKGQFRGQPDLLESLNRNAAAEIFTYKENEQFRLQYSRLQERSTPDEAAPAIKLIPQGVASPITTPDRIIEESRLRYGQDQSWVEKEMRRRRKSDLGKAENSYRQIADFWSTSDFYEPPPVVD